MEDDNIGLSNVARQLFSALRVARTPEDLVASGFPPQLLKDLLATGFLEPQRETEAPLDLQEAFGGLKAHRGMLVDTARTEAFRRAIGEVVQDGNTVIDVGTGSGVLAMFAAQAGAAEVYGLEMTAMADRAAEVAAANGLDNVQIVRGDAASFTPDAPVDVVLGEFIGLALLDEWRHFAAFAEVRDNALRPGGQVLPRAAKLLFSAVDSRRLYVDRGYGFWETPAYGLDFSALRQADIDWPLRYVVTADEKDVVDTAEVHNLDYLTATSEDSFFSSEVRLRYPVAGSFHGVLVHFELDLAPGITLGTGPAHRETCWHHSYLPLPMLQMPANSEVCIEATSFLDTGSGTLCLGLRVAGPGETLSNDLPQHIFPLE